MVESLLIIVLVMIAIVIGVTFKNIFGPILLVLLGVAIWLVVSVIIFYAWNYIITYNGANPSTTEILLGFLGFLWPVLVWAWWDEQKKQKTVKMQSPLNIPQENVLALERERETELQSARSRMPIRSKDNEAIFAAIDSIDPLLMDAILIALASNGEISTYSLFDWSFPDPVKARSYFGDSPWVYKARLIGYLEKGGVIGPSKKPEEGLGHNVLIASVDEAALTEILNRIKHDRHSNHDNKQHKPVRL